ncbi:MAG: hypothetical protein AB2712_16055, partial [Candidatus Thiodiazotropha sp.]
GDTGGLVVYATEWLLLINRIGLYCLLLQLSLSVAAQPTIFSETFLRKFSSDCFRWHTMPTPVHSISSPISSGS